MLQRAMLLLVMVTACGSGNDEHAPVMVDGMYSLTLECHDADCHEALGVLSGIEIIGYDDGGSADLTLLAGDQDMIEWTVVVARTSPSHSQMLMTEESQFVVVAFNDTIDRIYTINTLRVDVDIVDDVVCLSGELRYTLEITDYSLVHETFHHVATFESASCASL